MHKNQRRELIMLRNGFLGFILILASCTHRSKKYWQTETSQMELCHKAWKYVDLKQETDVNVLLFRKQFQVCMSSFPNFIIGVTPNLDTIGIVDTAFEGLIKKNQKIRIEPVQTVAGDLRLITKPCLTVYPNPKDNRLHGSVKIVYYGKIKTIDTN